MSNFGFFSGPRDPLYQKCINQHEDASALYHALMCLIRRSSTEFSVAPNFLLHVKMLVRLVRSYSAEANFFAEKKSFLSDNRVFSPQVDNDTAEMGRLMVSIREQIQEPSVHLSNDIKKDLIGALETADNTVAESFLKHPM